MKNYGVGWGGRAGPHLHVPHSALNHWGAFKQFPNLGTMEILEFFAVRTVRGIIRHSAASPGSLREMPAAAPPWL